MASAPTPAFLRPASSVVEASRQPSPSCSVGFFVVPARLDALCKFANERDSEEPRRSTPDPSRRTRAARVLAAQQGDLNTRQAALLGRAIKDPEVQFSARSHSMSHGVTNETARQDLLDLERRGYVVRGRAGRQHVWTPAPDLDQRLASTT